MMFSFVIAMKPEKSQKLFHQVDTNTVLELIPNGLGLMKM